MAKHSLICLFIATSFILGVFCRDAPKATKTWCVAKKGVAPEVLTGFISYACQEVDCAPIEDEHGACFDNNNPVTRGSWALDAVYRKDGATDEDCGDHDFAAVTTTNPSFGKCQFP